MVSQSRSRARGREAAAQQLPPQGRNVWGGKTPAGKFPRTEEEGLTLKWEKTTPQMARHPECVCMSAQAGALWALPDRRAASQGTCGLYPSEMRTSTLRPHSFPGIFQMQDACF